MGCRIPFDENGNYDDCLNDQWDDMHYWYGQDVEEEQEEIVHEQELERMCYEGGHSHP